VKITSITKRLVQRNSASLEDYREYYYLNIVFQSEAPEDLRLLKTLSSEWEKISVIRSIEEWEKYLWSLPNPSDKAKAVYHTGYRNREHKLEETKVTGVYTLREFYSSSPVVQAIINEFEMIRWSGQCYPGGIEATNSKIVRLIKALELFWD
jgi:hypothetical protein